VTDACKALEEQRLSERAAALALAKEATRNVERQLLATQKAAAPEADDTMSSPDDVTFSRDATVVSRLHAALVCYTLDDHVLTNKIDDTMYWYHYDGVVLTWMLDNLSVELQEIVREPSETARRAWLAIEAQFLRNREPHVLQLDE
jgi:hypothetical protein